MFIDNSNFVLHPGDYMLFTLPLEIVYSIVQSVDSTSDLRSLALCCSLLRDEAHRALFLHPITSPSQQKRFLATIIRYSHLALMVHTYAVRYPIELDRPSSRGVFADFSFALRSMRKLKRLALEAVNLTPWHLQGCTFKLDVFIWGSPLRIQDVTQLITGFLPWQPNLRHLGLFGAIQEQKMNPLFLRSLCPKLESLETSSDSVIDAFFAHRRNLRSLQWMTDSIGPTTTSPQLSIIENYRAIVGNRTITLPILRLLTSLVLLELVIAEPGTHLMLSDKVKSRPTFLKQPTSLMI